MLFAVQHSTFNATSLVLGLMHAIIIFTSSIMESAVSQALKKIEIFVEGFLSSPNRDSYRLVEYLVADEGKLKWLGSLEDLKLFIESSPLHRR